MVPASDGDLAERAQVDQLAEFGIEPARAPLGADLDHAIGLAGGLDDPATLADGHRERLFDIDILACLAGHDRPDGVPVVGSGHDDGVHVVAVEDFAEVLVPVDRVTEIGLAARHDLAECFEAGIDLVVLVIEIGVVNIRERDDLGVGVEGPQQLHAAIAHVDAADSHAIIGTQNGFRARPPESGPPRPCPPPPAQLAADSSRPSPPPFACGSPVTTSSQLNAAGRPVQSTDGFCSMDAGVHGNSEAQRIWPRNLAVNRT